MTRRSERTEKANRTLDKRGALPEEQAVVRVQVRAEVGIARGEHRPNLSPETRESEARHNRPSQSIFHADHFSENAPRGEPPPPPGKHAPSLPYRTSRQQPALKKECSAETRCAGMLGEAAGSEFPHFWGGVGHVALFDLLLRALILLARVERPFHNPSLHLRNTTRRRLRM